MGAHNGPAVFSSACDLNLDKLSNLVGGQLVGLSGGSGNIAVFTVCCVCNLPLI